MIPFNLNDLNLLNQIKNINFLKLEAIIKIKEIINKVNNNENKLKMTNLFGTLYF